MTPTRLRRGPYRFFFYSNEGSEPPHVHVSREASEAKFWLKPAEIAGSRGFRPHELTKIQALVEENHDYLLEQWHAFYGR